VRSLLDGVDLGAVRAAAGRGTGPFATAIACLQEGGVLQHDPDDPDWPDRDRVIDGASALRRWERSEIGLQPWWTSVPRGALGAGVGAALASHLDGGIFRVWCLLDGAGVDGASWDAARAAVRYRLATLTVLALADGTDDLAQVLDAAGWRILRSSPREPVEVLGAMDRAVAQRTGPVAIVGSS
jgi:transketolase